VIFASQPFGEPVYADAPAGQSLREILGDNDHINVCVGGVAVAPKYWAYVRPHAGTPVHVTRFPQGGSGGKWVRLVAMMVITYFTMGAGATWAAGWGLSAAATSAVYAGAFVMGALAVTPLIPPPEVQR
jgi:hypothetical protein